MSDILGNALQEKSKKKGRLSNAIKSHQHDLLPKRGEQNTNKKSKKTAMKICCFCTQKAAVLVQKSFTTKSFCLLHFYTSKSCRVDVNKIKVIEDEDMEAGELKTQLPFMQGLFSDAFTELQKDISTESTNSFQAMAERGNDPLSILLEPITNKKASKKVLNQNSSVTVKEDDEGGFLRQIQEKELSLIQQQSRRIESDVEKSFRNNKDDMTKSFFKRRKTSAKSSWHLVMSKQNALISNNAGEQNETKPWNPNFASGIKCRSCGSQKIEVDANITSSMNDVSKAQTWGAKRERDICTRYHCIECNKFWFEDN